VGRECSRPIFCPSVPAGKCSFANLNFFPMGGIILFFRSFIFAVAVALLLTESICLDCVSPLFVARFIPFTLRIFFLFFFMAAVVFFCLPGSPRSIYRPSPYTFLGPHRRGP